MLPNGRKRRYDTASLRHQADSSPVSCCRGSDSLRTSTGCRPSSTVARVMMHFCTSLRDGTSYITSCIRPSMMLRSPRAPVFRSSALRAIARMASSSISSSTPSMARSFLYCLIRALRGFVMMSTSASSVSCSSVTTTGSLPTNSGMSPYLSRSSGSSRRRPSASRSPG